MLIKKRIKLHEFNNLSKSLRFSFYDISYAESTEDKQGYNNYIHKTFSAEKLTEVLRTITQKIGAHILNLSCQDYEPVGASVCVLITEEPVNPEIVNPTNNLGKIEEIYAHLDKSHIAVHTYPEYSPKNNVASFRVDVEVSTCGKISPINCLNYLLEVFDSNVITDIVEIDYTIRGFTRSQSDKKIFIDHQINSITDFIKPKYIERYSIRNLDNPVERTWSTKLVVKKIDLPLFLYNNTIDKLDDKQKQVVINKIENEIDEISCMKNEYEIVNNTAK